MGSVQKFQASGPRLIDQRAAYERPLELQVLILGMPRTGSISIRMAMEQLGYKTFHGRMLDERPELYKYWSEAMRAKYLGEGEKYGREEFEKLLGEFSVSSNMPGTMFAEDLIKAYPNAKVIVTTRDFDAWAKSMKDSVDSAVSWKSFDWIAPWDQKIIGPWWSYHKLQHALRKVIAPKGERQAYKDHYELIEQLVPPERLLKMHISEGWEPLCEFLGREKPAFPFPNVNNTREFLMGRSRRWWRALGFMVAKVSAIGAIAGGVAWQFRAVKWRPMFALLK